MDAEIAKPPVERADVARLLTAAGIQLTPQRVEIAAILLEREQHLSAEQVLERVRTANVAVSKATVYNTLGLFAERGLVREVVVDPSRIFYDSNCSAHHHFFNVDDGELTDFPLESAVISALPEAPAGTTEEGVDIVIRVRNHS